MAKKYPKGWQTLWEKEKLLITSNFSFAHGVFKRLVLQTGKNQGLFGKGLKFNSLPNDKILDQSNLKDVADDKINVTYVTNFVPGRVENIWKKEKMLVTGIFSFFHYAFKRPLCQSR